MRKIFGKKKIPGFKIEENMSHTEEGTWPGSAIWKSNNTPAGSTVSTFNEAEESVGWGGPEEIKKEIPWQPHLKLHRISLDKEKNIWYCSNTNGWYFTDETERLHGPFLSWSAAVRQLKAYIEHTYVGG